MGLSWNHCLVFLFRLGRRVCWGIGQVCWLISLPSHAVECALQLPGIYGWISWCGRMGAMLSSWTGLVICFLVWVGLTRMGSMAYMAAGWGHNPGITAHWVLWPNEATAGISACTTTSRNVVCQYSCTGCYEPLLHPCLIPGFPGTASDALEARSKWPFWGASDNGVKKDVYVGWAFFCPMEKLKAKGGSSQFGAVPAWGEG